MEGERKVESLHEREGMMNEMDIEGRHMIREGDRPGLKEVDQNVMFESQAKKGASRTEGIGIGKRASDREGKEKMQNEEHNKENQRDIVLKRTRSLGEDEDIQKVREDLGNRSKWQKVGSTTISPIVGVASQK